MTEYYRKTNRSTSDWFTKGKIYRVRNPDNLETPLNFIDDKGIPNGFYPVNHLYFKPATFLEWQIQEGIVEVIHENYNYINNILNKFRKIK